MRLYPLLTGSDYGTTNPTIQLNACPGSASYISDLVYLSNSGSGASIQVNQRK